MARPSALARFRRRRARARRARDRRHRALRILGYNQQFPLLSETYIPDELGALAAHTGAEIAWARKNRAVAPMRVPEPVYPALEPAIAEFDPDLILVHWAFFAYNELEALDRADVPFALRGHGFDVNHDLFTAVLDHRLCIGAWTYPGPEHSPDGAHDLPLLFTSADRLPPAAPKRDLVLMVSAGLAKKNWPLVFEAIGDMSEVERRLVVAATEGAEDLPGELFKRCQAFEHPPLVQVNLPREDCFALMARAAVLFYTLNDDQPFGQPMAVAEGMASGCSVILPDRPQAREYAGPTARYYDSAESITGHVREVLAGGESVEAERAANREWAMSRFASPELGRRFADEVLAALERWEEDPAKEV